MNFEVLGIMQDLKRNVKVLELLQRLRDGFKLLDELITTVQDVDVKELITIIESNKISFRVLKTGTNDYSRKLGYKYNVQVLVNGRYSGVGRFCKTLKEVEAYKRNIRKD